MLNYLPPKSAFFNDSSCEVFMNENQGSVYSISIYLSPDITRDTIIFSVKQPGLHLVVLLKIMVLPRVISDDRYTAAAKNNTFIL